MARRTVLLLSATAATVSILAFLVLVSGDKDSLQRRSKHEPQPETVKRSPKANLDRWESEGTLRNGLDSEAPPSVPNDDNQGQKTPLLIRKLAPVQDAGEGLGFAKLLDADWMEWVPVERPSPGGETTNILARVASGPIYAGQDSDLPELRERLAASLATVHLKFDPPIPAELAAQHAVVITPAAGGGRMEQERVYGLQVPVRVEPVIDVAPRDLVQPLVYNDLHRGVRYRMDVVSRHPSVVGTRIDVGEAEFRPPATVNVLWKEPPGIEIVVEGVEDARGTVYGNPTASPRGPFTLCVLERNRAWRETGSLENGNYEVTAAGFDWFSSEPFPHVSVMNGVADVSTIVLAASRGLETTIRFEHPVADLSGVSVSYFDHNGERQNYPVVPTGSGLGVIRWRGSVLSLVGLKEAMDLLFYAPHLGAYVLRTVVPGENVSVKFDAAERRIFEEALNRALSWTEDNPGGGRAFLQMRVDGGKHGPFWIVLKHFNLSLDDYFRPEEWLLPVRDDGLYRLQIFPSGGGGALYVDV